MNYELEIQRSMPEAFYALNSDRSPLVAGSGSGTFRTASLNLQAFKAFVAGRELVPFTYEIWYLPVAVSTENVVIGHNGEGVLFDGTDFILRVKYEGGTILEQKYTPPEIKSFHVAMVYDLEAFYLYIDGDRVASVTADKTKSYLVASAGSSVAYGASKGTYDSAALYYRPLPGNELKLHYSWAKQLPPSSQIAGSLGGTSYELSYNSIRILQSALFDSTNWSMGQIDNLIDSGTLVGGVGGGTWSISVPVESIADVTTQGIHLTYAGKGVTMSYSTDATTWTTIANKRTVLEGTSSDGVTLYVKFDLVEGGYLTSVKIDALESRIVEPNTGQRRIQFQNTSFDQTPGHQLDYHVDQGAEIVTGYIDVLPDDSADIHNVQSVEVWAKVASNDGWFMAISGSQYVSVVGGSYTFAGMTAYRNGALVANGAFPKDEWAHYVFVLNTAANTTIRFGQKLATTDLLSMSVGHVATYPQALDAATVAKLYNMNIGAPLVRVNDPAAIAVTEPVPATQIYAYTWSK